MFKEQVWSRTGCWLLSCHCELDISFASDLAPTVCFKARHWCFFQPWLPAEDFTEMQQRFSSGFDEKFS